MINIYIYVVRGVDRIHVVQDGVQLFEHGNETACFIKGAMFLARISNLQLRKKVTALNIPLVKFHTLYIVKQSTYSLQSKQKHE